MGNCCKQKGMTKFDDVVSQAQSKDFLQKMETASKTRVLVLRKMKFKQVPLQCFNIVNLRVADFAHNKIKELPQEIQQFNQLETLIVSYNKLKQFPILIQRMEKLQKCFLDYNKIQFIPEISLYNVNELDLSNNEISVISDRIKCPQLQILYLSNNKLFEFPRLLLDHERVPNLDTVDLSFNSIQVLPPTGWATSKIERLNLSQNKLFDIPSDLFENSKI